jgi:prepilin-type N-terminal cleavage/methylation domain-containing protein
MGRHARASVTPSMPAGGAADQRGFTLVETLAAIAIIVVALVGLLTTMTSGVTDIDSARRSTTALFLAEQRLEHIKAFALSKAAGQGYDNVTTTSFPAEGYGAIAGHGDYRRTVVVVDNPGGTANTKQVEVWVFYRPVTTTGLNQETSVVISSLLAAR